MKKVALITGGAKRIGRAIGKALHADGYWVIIHYHRSQIEAQHLADELNAIHAGSAKILGVHLNIVNHKETLTDFKDQAMALFGRIDILVHNASSFYPSDINDEVDKWQNDWDDLFLTNAKAPLFLSHVFKDELVKNHGTIISLLDIHAKDKPFIGYPIYNMAKSAHHGMVLSLALELAPSVRVNGVSPGVNIFPECNKNHELNDSTKDNLIKSVPLQSIGTPDDIAQAVLFLVNAPYITGQIIAVDGGRSLTLKGS